eukprot:gene9939-18549_t
MYLPTDYANIEWNNNLVSRGQLEGDLTIQQFESLVSMTIRSEYRDQIQRFRETPREAAQIQSVGIMLLIPNYLDVNVNLQITSAYQPPKRKKSGAENRKAKSARKEEESKLGVAIMKYFNGGKNELSKEMHETEEAAINTKVITGEENCLIELENLKSKAIGDDPASMSYNVCISDTKSTVINSDPDYDDAPEEGSREDINRSDDRFPHLLLQYKSSRDLQKAFEGFCKAYKLEIYRCAEELLAFYKTFPQFNCVCQAEDEYNTDLASDADDGSLQSLDGSDAHNGPVRVANDHKAPKKKAQKDQNK